MSSWFPLIVCLLCVSSAVLIESESAFYVPRSFYVIDSEGHQSPVSLIGADHIAHRLKRSSSGGYVSSSSSSSSSSSNGGPVYFQQSSQQSNGPINGFAPQPPLFQNLGPLMPFPPLTPFPMNNFGTQNQFPTSNNFGALNGGLDSRFDDSPNTPVQSQQQTQVFNGPSNGGSGVYTSTTGVRLPNGQVQYTTQTGKF